MLGIIACSIVLAAAPNLAQTLDVKKLEDGTEVHCAHVVTADGERVRHGEYRVVLPDGTKTVLGEYDNGRRDGRWRFWRPDGVLHATGTYRADRRTGVWSLYQGVNAQLFAKGRFIEGAPAGNWELFDELGKADPARSGTLEQLSGTGAWGVTYRGFLHNGRPHGPWRLTWSDGSPLLLADFDRGTPLGAHEFTPPGGVDAHGMACSSHTGVWFEPGRAWHPLMFDDLDDLGRAIAPTPAVQRSLRDTLGALQRPEAPVGAPPFETVALTANEVATAVVDGPEYQGARARLASWGPEVSAWWALCDLLGTDWSAPQSSGRALVIVHRILVPALGCPAGDWEWKPSPDAADKNRSALLRALGYYWLLQFFPDYWALDLPLLAGRAAMSQRYDCLAGWVVPVERWAKGRVGLASAIAPAPARNLRAAGGSGTEQALKDSLEWLTGHQDEDGRWDCSGFMKHDSPSDQCDGAGDPGHDIGVTGLALLALIRSEEGHPRGRYRDTFLAGLRWLLDQQDPESGEFVTTYTGLHNGTYKTLISGQAIYGHAIATQVLAEVVADTPTPLTLAAAQRAVKYLHAGRNPYGAWRYDVPPIGDNDTSVTGWAVAALDAARRAGLRVDPEAFRGAMAWFDEVTDPATGRCGYDSIGNLSNRYVGKNEDYPPEFGEAMTAIAITTRMLLGQRPDQYPLMRAGADRLIRCLPKWEPNRKAHDMYYWYYGTQAMFQFGGRHWELWNNAMKSAILSSQRQTGAAKGSWDPIGPWGYAGGRVYSTSLMALTLCTYWQPRYSPR